MAPETKNKVTTGKDVGRAKTNRENSVRTYKCDLYFIFNENAFVGFFFFEVRVVSHIALLDVLLLLLLLLCINELRIGVFELSLKKISRTSQEVLPFEYT